jgi:hypothetical protein
MQSTVSMSKAEHQGGLRRIAGDANHGAVGCTLPLNLHPFALTCLISTVAALGDHALETGHKSPAIPQPP